LTLTTIREMWGLESRSRTSRSRSRTRLLWRSFGRGFVSKFEPGLGGYGLDYVTASYHKRMWFHHQETSNRHAKRPWSLCYISFTRMVNSGLKSAVSDFLNLWKSEAIITGVLHDAFSWARFQSSTAHA